MPLDSPQHLWETVLGRLQVQVTRPSFDTWLRGTEGVTLTDDHLLVGAPTTFAAEWLSLRMQELVHSAVSAVTGKRLQVTFQVSQGQVSQNGADHLPPAESPPTAALPAATLDAQAPAPPPAASSLNSRYTFDSFVVGPSCQLACAAAMAVAERPGEAYNPLFIYADVGMGKTHLLQAIAHRVRSHGKVGRYLSMEQFTNEFISAIRDRKTAEFRDRYRAVDVLLIDDVQFLAGKEQTQEGFFHTFNALHQANRQIVLASDRPPSALPQLGERLRSRFEWGLTTDMQMPATKTRLAILRNKARETAVPVPDDVLAYIAGSCNGSIRQLEGNLNKITAMAHFTGQPATLALCQHLLPPPAGSNGTNGHHLSSPAQILQAVANHYQLSVETLTGPQRDKHTAAARRAATYLLQEIPNLRPTEIGHVLGGRDRTSIIYILKTLAQRHDTDITFQHQISAIHQALVSSH